MRHQLERAPRVWMDALDPVGQPIDFRSSIVGAFQDDTQTMAAWRVSECEIYQSTGGGNRSESSTRLKQCARVSASRKSPIT